MSFENQENKEILNESTKNIADSQSTIFSAPEEKDDKRANKSFTRRIIAALAAVAVLITGTVAAVKLIPEKQEKENTDSSLFALSLDESKVDNISLKNSSGEMVLKRTVTENNDSSQVLWSIDGINSEYTDSSSIQSVAKTLTSLSAIKQIEQTDADFGFSSPVITAKITLNDSPDDNYTVLLGNNAPANMGIYCKVTTPDSEAIYLCDVSIGTSLESTAIDFAETSGVSAITKTDKNSKYFTDEVLTGFDYITISGSKYPETLKILMQDDESVNGYFAYKIIAPSKRIADDSKVEEILNIFSGTTGAGAYSFESTDEQLKKYGLDNPDAILTVCVGNETRVIRAKQQDSNYCAVLLDNSAVIKKIATSSLPFVSNSLTDYYSSFIILENLSGLSGLKVETADKTYNFDLVYTEETDETEQSYTASIDGVSLDISNFKSYYQEIISLTPVAYESRSISDTEMNITFVHSNGTKDVVLAFKVYSPQRYQVEMDGIPMGQITKSAFDKLVSLTEKVATGQSVK